MRTRLALIGVLAFLLPAGVAHAAVGIDVTRTDDPTTGGAFCGKPSTNCSLRNAIAHAQANGPDGQTVTVPPGTYELTRGELAVTKTVFIDGAGARTTTIEQLKPGSRVFDVTKSGVVDVSFGLTGATVTGGSVTDASPNGSSGGGIYGGLVGMTLTDVAVVGNRIFATPSGTDVAAGAGISASGSLALKRSTVAGNHATSSGIAVGGIADFGSVYTDDSTISGNVATVAEPPSSAAAVGGILVGFSFGGAGLLSTASVTIADNSASGATGSSDVNVGNVFVGANSSELHWVDTIIARGSGDKGLENCGIQGAAVFDRGYNLQDQGQHCGFTGASDRTVGNALLGPLANNGGQTDTQALFPGSPAIDHGQPGKTCPDSGSGTLTTDQRGAGRVQGGRCDIGAFESVGIPAPKLTKLKIKPTRFAASAGATISYNDSRSVQTTLTVLRRIQGVRKGGKCVPAKKGLTGKACTLFKTVGSFKHADKAGTNKFHWSAKVKGKLLKRGRYRLTAVARDAQGRSSAPVSTGFKVTG